MKFLAPISSGKLEFMSGKSQGIVREFGSVLFVETLGLNYHQIPTLSVSLSLCLFESLYMSLSLSYFRL